MAYHQFQEIKAYMKEPGPFKKALQERQDKMTSDMGEQMLKNFNQARTKSTFIRMQKELSKFLLGQSPDTCKEVTADTCKDSKINCSRVSLLISILAHDVVLQIAANVISGSDNIYLLEINFWIGSCRLFFLSFTTWWFWYPKLQLAGLDFVLGHILVAEVFEEGCSEEVFVFVDLVVDLEMQAYLEAW